MNDDDPQPESAQPDLSPIKVVLAYDGEAAFHAAKRVYHGIMGRLAGQFGFRECWLPFSGFAEPAFVVRAVIAAREADIVFCCPNNAYLLPGNVQDWIRLWLARRRLPSGALAVLLPLTMEKSPYQTPVERDLRATARANGLAFFAHEYIQDGSLDSRPHAPEIFPRCECPQLSQGR